MKLKARFVRVVMSLGLTPLHSRIGFLRRTLIMTLTESIFTRDGNSRTTLPFLVNVCATTYLAHGQQPSLQNEDLVLTICFSSTIICVFGESIQTSFARFL